MNQSDAKVGRWVESNREFSGVPKGTEGLIIQDYGTGIMVAWQLFDHPIPSELSIDEIVNMPAVNPKCPLRDGFDKETELQHLKLIN